MLGQTILPGPCDTCRDNGRDPKNRKRPCPTCKGSYRAFCATCHQPVPCGGVNSLDGDCEKPPCLTNGGKPEQLILKVQPDGTRSKVALRDVRDGDLVHFVGHPQVHWRKVITIIGDPYQNESGVWTVNSDAG